MPKYSESEYQSLGKLQGFLCPPRSRTRLVPQRNVSLLQIKHRYHSTALQMITRKKIDFGVRNCQYCSESDSSDCDEDDEDEDDDEDEHAHCNMPRRAPKGTLYRPRPPLGLVHQARPRPSIYPNNWGRQLPPRAWGFPPQPPLLPPAPPHLYGYQNPYGYNLMPPPHAYGYQNPYNYNFINGIMPVPRPVYPH